MSGLYWKTDIGRTYKVLLASADLTYFLRERLNIFLIFQMYVALHSYGEKVMYPWSHSKEKLPDWQELHSVGVTMADAITSISGIPFWVNIFWKLF